MRYSSNTRRFLFGLMYVLLFVAFAFGLKIRFPFESGRYLVSLFQLILLGIIFETDRRHNLISLFPAILLGVTGLMDQTILQDQSIASVLVGVGSGGIFFVLQYVLSKGKVIGEGDIYLGMALGSVFGLPRLLAVLLIAYVVGSLVSLFLLATGRIKKTDPIPLGSFLVVGSIVVLFLDRPWALLGL